MRKQCYLLVREKDGGVGVYRLKHSGRVSHCPNSGSGPYNYEPSAQEIKAAVNVGAQFQKRDLVERADDDVTASRDALHAREVMSRLKNPADDASDELARRDLRVGAIAIIVAIVLGLGAVGYVRSEWPLDLAGTVIFGAVLAVLAWIYVRES